MSENASNSDTKSIKNRKISAEEKGFYLPAPSLANLLLNQIPKPLPHPQSLILTLQKLAINLRQLTTLQLPIQPHNKHPENPASQNRDAKHGSDNPVTRSEAVSGEGPDVRSRDITELREGVDESDGYGAFGGWAGEGRADPAVEDYEAGVGTCLEEEGDVAACRVQSRHADDEADETDADWADDVEELFGKLV